MVHIVRLERQIHSRQKHIIERMIVRVDISNRSYRASMVGCHIVEACRTGYPNPTNNAYSRYRPAGGAAGPGNPICKWDHPDAAHAAWPRMMTVGASFVRIAHGLRRKISMLTVHHLGTSQSERIVWLCEELGLDYALKRYERQSNLLAPKEYRALHPMGTAPTITDGDLVLGESAAICDYINIRHGGGRLAPAPDDADFADHLFWFHWANGTYMAGLMIEVTLAMSGASLDRVGFVADRARRCREAIELRLGESPFFGGRNLTTADIMMVYCLTAMRRAASSAAEQGPNTQAYLKRIGERPAYRRAMAKAEPDRPRPEIVS
jgi:glutathione S-transferase